MSSARTDVRGDAHDGGVVETDVPARLDRLPLMVAAGVVEASIGVKAERRSLETLAAPLSAVTSSALAS